MSAIGKALRKLFSERVQDRIDTSVTRTDKNSQLDKNGYSERQAMESGYRNAYREILTILEGNDNAR